MRSKLGTALDIFILLIGLWIIYTRVVDIMNNGISIYPLLSVIIVSLAVIFAIYNLYLYFMVKPKDDVRKR